MNKLIIKYKNKIESFELYLKKYIDSKEYLSLELKDSISYSIFRGGKRIRPVFSFLTAESLKIDPVQTYHFASVIELIHNYSLVHDDLPEMDNDDYRRGKESTHKKYGNMIGLLAGDALLSLASEMAFDDNFESEKNKKIDAYKFVFNMAGSSGMIDGQAFESKAETFNDYRNVMIKKTSNLFRASITGAAIYLGANLKTIQKLDEFACSIGESFQILDDFMDHENDEFYKKHDIDILELINEKNAHIKDLLKKLSDDIDTSYFEELVKYLFSEEYIKNEAWYLFKHRKRHDSLEGKRLD